MEAIIEYFSTIPSSHRSAILVGGITFFWLAESAIPLFRFEYQKWKHALINIFFTLTTVGVNLSLAFILLLAADWTVANGVGLLPWMFGAEGSEVVWLPAGVQLALYILIGLLLLDLISAWFAHWIQHKVTWMWRFHLIHHTDTHIDTTTANRHHPGESVIRFFFTVLAVLALGAPMWMVLLYQSLSVVLSQFNHANIALPVWLDRGISWFIVSPNMHKVHHHYVQPYTDSNYGNIFSVWDRLFGTFRTLEPGELVYGVDTHMKPEHHSDVGEMLRIPFKKP
jgi:sterol desaturase/sphingolipid hydroxylase (fatty acid hydroxylase superfamily)